MITLNNNHEKYGPAANIVVSPSASDSDGVLSEGIDLVKTVI